MKQLKNITLVFMSCLLFQCSEEVKIESGNFVVEGFIVANEEVNNIKVKGISPIGADSITSEPISDAVITISQGTDSYMLDYNPETELYEYDGIDLSIDNNEEYSLEVIVNDRVANSTTLVPEPPMGLLLPRDHLIVPELTLSFGLREQIQELFAEERITLTWDAVPGQNYFVVIENKVEVLDPLLPEGVPEDAIALLQSFRFISAPTEETSFEIIAIALETYGPHVAKVYTVNQEYVDLYENSEQDSRDLNEPPSNISNALGIFTAFAVDSVEFEVRRP